MLGFSRACYSLSSKHLLHRIIARRYGWFFSRDPAIPTTRRASKVCTSLITAHSDEELALFDSSLLDLIYYHQYPFNRLDEYLTTHPDFVMGNVICCISSLLSGLGTPKVYFDRIEDALKSDPKEKDFTHNEHLYLHVLKGIRCNRVRYAINTLEMILMSDPVDILAINTLFSLYQQIGESSKMFGSISRTWSYWGIGIPCDSSIPGYRSHILIEMDHIE